MNKDEFIIEVKKLGIDLTKQQIEQFEIYANFLIEYNSHTNLTAIKDKEEIYLKHFYDSLTILKNNSIDYSIVKNIIDVGTGAGFPGMVLKIVFPEIDVILLDSNNKKTKFLVELKDKLNLKKLNIICERSEEYAKQNIDKYDLVVSRAVANMTILSELCLPLTKVGGYFISLKGNVKEELDNAKDIIKKLNGKVEKIEEFNLIKENATRNIVYIKKINETPSSFPRPYAKIKKEYEKSISK